jgi:hypothetical protein
MSTANQTYYFVAAGQSFFDSEPLDEVLEERTRYYSEHQKPIDFFYVLRPAFLQSPAFTALSSQLPSPAASVISTDPQFILWLKVRLTFVESGEFIAPSELIPDPLASLPA